MACLLPRSGTYYLRSGFGDIRNMPKRMFAVHLAQRPGGARDRDLGLAGAGGAREGAAVRIGSSNTARRTQQRASHSGLS